MSISTVQNIIKPAEGIKVKGNVVTNFKIFARNRSVTIIEIKCLVTECI
jgi:hypothetical protein